MIALCPTCHDAVHNGTLRIDDKRLYRWKNIVRPGLEPPGYLYVEPGDECKLLTGTIAIAAPAGCVVFELAQASFLSFLEDRILHLNLRLSTRGGREILRVTDGHVVQEDDRLHFEARPGHVHLSAPASEEYISVWALRQMQRADPSFAGDGTLVLLDLEVLEPGLVRVQGVWADPDLTVVITPEQLAFCRQFQAKPIILQGEGAGSVLKYVGPIGTSLFAAREPIP